jgi:hypothetical protein
MAAHLDVRTGPARPALFIIPSMTDERSADIIPIDEHAALCLAASEENSPLLQALIDGTTLERLVASVEQLYSDGPDRLAGDVDRLLDTYSRQGHFAA